MFLNARVFRSSVSSVFVCHTGAELEQSVAKKHRHGTAALKPKTRGNGSMRGALERMLINMFRDMQDVGFYVGKYAAKKFKISRSLLPSCLLAFSA